MPIITRKLVGHYNYYGITDNFESINKFKKCVLLLLFKWLNRRSQKASYDRKGFEQMLKIFKIPKPTIKVNIYAI